MDQLKFIYYSLNNLGNLSRNKIGQEGRYWPEGIDSSGSKNLASCVSEELLS